MWHTLRSHLALNAGPDVCSHMPGDRNEFSSASFSGFAGVDCQRNGYVYRAVLRGGDSRADGDGYRNAVRWRVGCQGRSTT